MILCIGTTPTLQRTMVFTRLVPGEVNRSAEVYETASGKSVNVARVLTVLGEKARASGFVGGDRGQMLLRELGRLGIEHDFVQVQSRTRLCTTLIDRSAGLQTELVEESAPVPEAHWHALRQKLPRLLEGVNLLVLSGSLPPGGPAGFYAECIQAARQRGVESILDASGEPLVAGLAAGPLLAKPNRAELAATLRRELADEADVIRSARELALPRGVRWVLVTLGAPGAILVNPDEAWRVVSPKVEATNSIGSGDAFTAGVAAALVHGRSMPEACRLGAACGAANALTMTSGEVRAADVARLESEVRLHRIPA